MLKTNKKIKDEPKRHEKLSASARAHNRNETMEDLRAFIRDCIERQYEDGFKNVHDIDNLTDKISTGVTMFLDIEPDFSYNGS